MALEDVRERLRTLFPDSPAEDGSDEDDVDEEPVFLSPAEIAGLKADDLPRQTRIQVGVVKNAVHNIEIEGTLTRGTKSPIQIDMTPSWYRKYWPLPLGMGQYVDLVRRAIETRARTRGDVELGHFDSDDDVWIHLHYMIHARTDDVAQAYEEARRIDAELREPANALCERIDTEAAAVAQKLSGWGKLTLEQLIDQIETQESSDAKGRILEELTCRLLETVPGFKVGGRVRTETEEIDIRIINGSDDPIWKRESALILTECKNWSSKCGKNEFVLFQEKLRNRHTRCACGLFVSWNGFAETVTKEMLRGSTSEFLIIPASAKDLRDAVMAGSFQATLTKLWERATML